MEKTRERVVMVRPKELQINKNMPPGKHTGSEQKKENVVIKQ